MGTSLEGDIMRTETEIRRRLVYLMQQKGYLMQDRELNDKLEGVLKEIEVLKWVLRMEDN